MPKVSRRSTAAMNVVAETHGYRLLDDTYNLAFDEHGDLNLIKFGLIEQDGTWLETWLCLRTGMVTEAYCVPQIGAIINSYI
ncbi:hypothetical protein [Deinococcus ruber]|uniref:Uncharacterized protein n=1 Tax=Deinococcus ruber TaxID=1848197 RepID=A0A918C7D3_9DEIO|nr:hypothetical protein [Deinococcus ruber]GGR09591.1 hypothetical protein GCM10008957_22910 [Deinococcus ruber]